ncbi:MAG: metalloregulator ArsR/SmtB family transcription factor [Pseudomonadota bacterium]
MTYDDALDALGDRRRREIFQVLGGARLTVAQIASRQPVSRPAVSQHLKVLAQAGLVRVEVEGTRHYYRVRREGLAELRAWVDGFWGDVLESFAADVERRMAGEETQE